MNKIVCPTCRGNGSHVNPAIDGNGITAQEMDELGPEFLEDYLSGVYDVLCATCKGVNVIDGCIIDGCTEPTLIAEYRIVFDAEYYEGDASNPGRYCYDHAEDEARHAVDEHNHTAAMHRAEIAAGA